MLFALVSITRPGTAQEFKPAPCARANVPATVVHAVRGTVSPLAAQQDIFGSVEVAVSLDAESRIVATRIQNTPSALLNADALAAARASSFQTEIKDCRAVPSDFFYRVDFPEKVRYGVLPSGERTISIVADVTITRPPDAAIVEASIETYDAARSRAWSKNDGAYAALKAKLRALGVTELNVRASRSTQSTGRGYTAERVAVIAVATVANASKAALAMAAVPFVDVLGIRYVLHDHAAAYREARELALKDAELSAQRALPPQMLNLGPILRIDEPPNAGAADPTEYVPFHRALMVTPPALQGPAMLEVHATATVTYTLLKA